METSWSKPVHFQTGKIGSPSFREIEVNGNEVMLSWSPPRDTFITGYRLHITDQLGKDSREEYFSAKQKTYKVNKLHWGQIYKFKLFPQGTLVLYLFNITLFTWIKYIT